jgi:hypothetical protein
MSRAPKFPSQRSAAYVRPALVTYEEMLRLLPPAAGAAGGESAWYKIAGSDGEWSQRPEYPYKKHDVTLQAPRPTIPPVAAAAVTIATAIAPAIATAIAPAAPARPARAASGFVTKRMVQDLLESVLADFDPLTTLYTTAMRRRAGEELRLALLEFGSSAEAHFHFGMPKTQAALSALSGAKHPDIWAIRDMLVFILDRDEISLPAGTPLVPSNSAKVF